jgi:hypothetical protein
MTHRGVTFTETVTLETEDCATCGVLFAMTDSLVRELRKSHRSFYCPNGHSMHYTAQTEEEKLRAQAASLRAQLDQEEAAHKATKRQMANARKRAANGVCPCCNRSFVQLARHMKSKHPDFG